MRLSSIAAAAAVVLIFSVSPGLAGHGKVGLWKITTTISAPSMASQIPPADLAKMKKMGIKMPSADDTITVQHCMTAQEVAMDGPPRMKEQKYCKVANMKAMGQSFSADMVCDSDEMRGTGHFWAAYDSAEHYKGAMKFQGTSRGRPFAMSTAFEGHWMSASCGKVKD